MTLKRKRHGRAKPKFRPGPGFLGLEHRHTRREAARVLVLPIPYEATSSYGTGTRDGPEAIIAASAQVELYDRESGCEPALKLGFHTLPALEPDLSGPERMVARIAAAAGPLYRSGKFLLALGGEHTVSAGLVRAAARRWPPLCVVHLDAHADLRGEYEGTRFSHACAARRMLDGLPKSGGVRLVQVGVRNVSAEGDRFRKAQGRRVRTFWAEDIAADPAGDWLEDLGALVAGRPVYLTVDLDALDPSIMPSTGTPEPGGLGWYETLEAVGRIASSGRLVAADIVELAPQAGNRAPDFLAAKLGYFVACRACSR